MTATVRSVRVVLNADVAKYVADMKLAGRATKDAFSGVGGQSSEVKRAMDDISKSEQAVVRDMEKVSTQSRRTSTDLDGVSTSSRKLTKDLDTMSGRAHLMLDALVLMGPALAPIGALGVPAFVGLAGAAGASVTALGATVIAMQGIGDAFKALDKARIEPTAENIQAAREATDELAPAAQRLVAHLYGMRDEWIKTRNITQQGLFPGVDRGIDKLERRLPEVQRFLFDISRESGTLFEQGATSLSGSRWDAFFTYLNDYGRPLLDDTADAIGNVAHGLGEVFAATAPDQLSFTRWLVGATESFDKWATRMQETDGFREFMDYAAKEGPKVAHAAGAIADAIIQIVEAAAPLGGPSLEAITAVSTAIANIADSDAGTPLLAVAAGLTAVARARKLLEAGGRSDFITTGYVTPLKEIPKTIPSISQLGTVLYTAGQSSKYASEETIKARRSVGEFGKSLAPVAKGAAVLTGIAVASSGVADSMHFSNTASLALMGTIAGPWGTAIGAGAGAALDFSHALHDGAASAKEFEDQLARAAATGGRSALVDTISAISDEIDNLKGKTDTSSFLFGNPLTFIKSRNELDRLPGTLAAAKDALEAFDASGGHTGDMADLLGETIGLTGNKFRLAAGDVQTFSAALAGLNGWLDKRDAFRNYEDSLDTFGAKLRKGIRNFDITTEKGRENQAQLDNVARSVLQVANAMKSPTRRANFVHDAIGNLREMATKASPEARAAIRGVIGQLRTLDATPAKPKLDVDNKPAEAKIQSTKASLRAAGHAKAVATLDANRAPAASGFQWLYGQLRTADAKTANPKIRVDAGNSAAVIGGVQARLNALRDRTVHITTVANKINAGGGGAGGAHPAGADGMTVPGPRQPYGDKVLAYLAPGEEVITNRNGEADQFRRDRAAGRIPAYADGGEVGRRRPGRGGADQLTGFGKWLSVAELSVRISNLTSGQIRHLGREMDDLGQKKLRRLGTALDKATKIVDKRRDAEKQHYDDLVQQKGAYQSTVAGTFNHDPFGNGAAGFNAQVDADTNDANAMLKALRAAEKRGLSGGLLGALAASGDLNTAQQFATMSRAQIAAEERKYQARTTAQNALGKYAADNQFNAQIAASKRSLDRLDATQKQLHHVLTDLRHEVREGARQGTRDGMDARNRDAAQRSRTSSGRR